MSSNSRVNDNSKLTERQKYSKDNRQNIRGRFSTAQGTKKFIKHVFYKLGEEEIIMLITPTSKQKAALELKRCRKKFLSGKSSQRKILRSFFNEK